MAKKPTGSSAGCTQLKTDLKNRSLGRCYLICGEEDYLCRYYYGQLFRQLIDPMTEDFNFHRLTSENFSVRLLTDSLEALPMMAEKSLVQLDGVDLFSLKESEAEQLANILSDLPEYCCLVATGSDLQIDKRKKLWKTLEKVAVVAEFNYQDETELRPWIVRHFRASDKSISTDLCTYLLAQCGQSMTRLHAEIEKICAYCPSDTVSRADIDAVVEPTVDAMAFQLTDALAERKFDRAMERLHAMFKLQSEPIYLVAAIGSQMRRLRAAKILNHPQELAEVCGMASFAASKTMTQARRFSEKFCDRAVLLCEQTDYRLKMSYDDANRLVELLILELAEEARRD